MIAGLGSWYRAEYPKPQDPGTVPLPVKIVDDAGDGTTTAMSRRQHDSSRFASEEGNIAVGDVQPIPSSPTANKTEDITNAQSKMPNPPENLAVQQEEVKLPEKLVDIGLRQKICEVGQMTVSFDYKEFDNRRYKELGGSVIIKISDCDPLSGNFKVIQPIADYVEPENGRVGQNSLDLKFSYDSLSRRIRCHVTAARIKAFPFNGQFSCFGSNDEFSLRPAVIEF